MERRCKILKECLKHLYYYKSLFISYYLTLHLHQSNVIKYISPLFKSSDKALEFITILLLRF